MMFYLQFCSHIKVDFPGFLSGFFLLVFSAETEKTTHKLEIENRWKKYTYFADVLTLTFINNMKYNVVEN